MWKNIFFISIFQCKRKHWEIALKSASIIACTFYKTLNIKNQNIAECRFKDFSCRLGQLMITRKEHMWSLKIYDCILK